jgi:hypothetical protein
VAGIFSFQTGFYYRAHRTEVKANKQDNIPAPVLRKIIVHISSVLFSFFLLQGNVRYFPA